MAVFPLKRPSEPTVSDVMKSLVDRWASCKDAEIAAKNNRLAVEQEIVDAMPATSDECITKYVDEANSVKVAVTYGVTRSVDTAALQKKWTEIPAFGQDAFRWKAEPNIAILRNLAENHPQIYARCAAFISSKPSKPSVKVEGA